jgi:hypothetical protein
LINNHALVSTFFFLSPPEQLPQHANRYRWVFGPSVCPTCSSTRCSAFGPCWQSTRRLV